MMDRCVVVFLSEIPKRGQGARVHMAATRDSVITEFMPIPKCIVRIVLLTTITSSSKLFVSLN